MCEPLRRHSSHEGKTELCLTKKTLASPPILQTCAEKIFAAASWNWSAVEQPLVGKGSVTQLIDFLACRAVSPSVHWMRLLSFAQRGFHLGTAQRAVSVEAQRRLRSTLCDCLARRRFSFVLSMTSVLKHVPKFHHLFTGAAGLFFRSEARCLWPILLWTSGMGRGQRTVPFVFLSQEQTERSC